jgi:hypothetical protein
LICKEPREHAFQHSPTVPRQLYLPHRLHFLVPEPTLSLRAQSEMQRPGFFEFRSLAPARAQDLPLQQHYVRPFHLAS